MWMGVATGIAGVGVVAAALAARASSRASLRGGTRATAAPRPRPSDPTVSVVVPALNEQGSIDWVLQNIPDWVDEVVLVDGLSIDLTEVVARQLVDNLVVVHQRQRGKGAALRAGFTAATSDIIVMIDADGSTNPQEIGRFAEALRAGADFVKGSRHMRGGGSIDFTPLRKAGNLGFVVLHNLLYRSRFTDLCYGYCAFWRSDLDVLALNADGFEIEMQLIANAVKANLDIVEVPSVELERRAGDSNLNTFRDGMRVLKTLLREHPRLGSAQPGEQIDLVAVHAPAVSADAWRPAGSEQRRWSDRRQMDAQQSGYVGPERRTGDRREPIGETAAVLVPADQTAVAVPLPDRVG